MFLFGYFSFTFVTNKLISNIDVVVDGKFDETKMDKTLKFRGSTNQRIIDEKKL